MSKTTNPLTEIEWTTCWMAIRYAMNRMTAASASLPEELCRAYGERWSDGQKRVILRDLEQHLERNGHFGDLGIDHPYWMRFVEFLKQQNNEK